MRVSTRALKLALLFMACTVIIDLATVRGQTVFWGYLMAIAGMLLSAYLPREPVKPGETRLGFWEQCLLIVGLGLVSSAGGIEAGFYVALTVLVLMPIGLLASYLRRWANVTEPTQSIDLLLALTTLTVILVGYLLLNVAGGWVPWN